MSEMKHTPEPWGIETTDTTLWIGPLRRDGHKIAEIVTSLDVNGLKMDYKALKKANASRIVACVNALAGIQDPEAWVREAKAALRIWEVLPAEEFLDDHDELAVCVFRRIARILGNPYSRDAVTPTPTEQKP